MDADLADMLIPRPWETNVDGIKSTLYCVKFTIDYYLRILGGSNSIKKSTTISVEYVFCNNVDEDGWSLLAKGLVDVPVNMDVSSSSYVTWSPVAINPSLDRVLIPYNKTTEREVIHLDNRLKSTE